MAHSTTEQLDDLLSERILVLDGDIQSVLQEMRLSEQDYRGDHFEDPRVDLKSLNDVLNLSQPGLIAVAHGLFLEAGADIVRTITFGSNAINLSDYGLAEHVYAINVAAAGLARREADAMCRRTPDRPRFVAGTIGPTNRMLSLSMDLENPGSRQATFDQLVVAYTPQVEGLIDGGADILHAWHVLDTLNLKSLLFAIDQVFDEKGVRLPVMVSLAVIDMSGRTLSGQTIEAFWISISGFDLFSVGLGHGGDLSMCRSFGERLSRIAHTYVSLSPDAGEYFPQRCGQPAHDPQHFAASIRGLTTDAIANIVGGSWYATPDHIRAIAKAVEGVAPRRRPERSRSLCLSGLEPLIFDEAKPVKIDRRSALPDQTQSE